MKQDIALRGQQKAFIEHLADSGDALEAAKLAGYANPHAAVRRFSGSGASSELLKVLLSKLANELSPIALSVLKTLLESSTTSDRVKLEAAKIVLDRVGIVPRKEPESETQALADMPIDDLQALVDRMRRDRSDNAKPVIDAHDTQSIDIFS